MLTCVVYTWYLMLIINGCVCVLGLLGYLLFVVCFVGGFYCGGGFICGLWHWLCLWFCFVDFVILVNSVVVLTSLYCVVCLVCYLCCLLVCVRFVWCCFVVVFG